MARCGCGGSAAGGSCGCVLADGVRTTVSGAGTPDSPYTVDLAGDFLLGSEGISGALTVSGAGQAGSPFVLDSRPSGNPSNDYVYAAALTSSPTNLNTLVDANNDDWYTTLLLSIGASQTLTLSSSSLYATATFQRFRLFVRATAAATLTLPAESTGGVRWTGGAAPAPIAMTLGQIVEFEFAGSYQWATWMARQVTPTPYS